METHDLTGVEIFSAGVWNGDEYDVNDLNGMVEAFNKHKETVRPFLKLGHDEDQSLIQKDGLPAAGWIERLYVNGEKLLADFSSIPRKIFDLIKAKAYRNVSSEIYWNVKIGEEYHKHMLGAVALLGADTPAVMNLSDIMAMYSRIVSDDKRTYQLTAAFGGKEQLTMEKTEVEVKLEADLKAKADEIEALKKEYSKKEEDAKAKETELEQLRVYKMEAEKKAADALLEAEKAKVSQYCTELVSQKLISVAMKPYIEALLDDKKEYEFETKKLDRKEVLSEMLKLFKAFAEVNFVESSSKGEEKSKDTDKELDAKITAYSKEKGLSYGAAAKIILAQQQQ